MEKNEFKMGKIQILEKNQDRFFKKKDEIKNLYLQEFKTLLKEFTESSKLRNDYYQFFVRCLCLHLIIKPDQLLKCQDFYIYRKKLGIKDLYQVITFEDSPELKFYIETKKII